jgi:hypothetical protein
VHGPFPIRVGRLFAVPAALLFVLICSAMALESERVTCNGDGACTTEHFMRQRSFSAAQLEGAHVDIETGSKGAKYGVVVLEVRTAPIRLMRVDPNDAEEAAAAINRAKRERRPFEVELHGPRAGLIGAALALLVAVSLLYSGLKRLGRFHLDLVQRGTGLRVQRRILGVPFGRARELSLEDVVDVEVEHGAIKQFWGPKGQPTLPGGRLALAHRSGLRSPLIEDYPGQAVHLHAAAHLRALLGFEPKPGGAEDQLAHLPLIQTPIATRIGLGWVGLTSGSMLGFLAFAVFGFATGLGGPHNTMMPWMLAGAPLGAIAGVTIAILLTQPHRPR